MEEKIISISDDIEYKNINKGEKYSATVNLNIVLSDEKSIRISKILSEKHTEELMMKKILNLLYDEDVFSGESIAKEKEKAVTKLLSEFGLTANTKGYRYLREAIILVAENPLLMENITGKLYPIIAENNDSTCTRVERAIRHAIESCCLKGDIEKIYRYFPFCVTSEKGKPTNSQFIAVLGDEIRMHGTAV